MEPRISFLCTGWVGLKRYLQPKILSLL